MPSSSYFFLTQNLNGCIGIPQEKKEGISAEAMMSHLGHIWRGAESEQGRSCHHLLFLLSRLAKKCRHERIPHRRRRIDTWVPATSYTLCLPPQKGSIA